MPIAGRLGTAADKLGSYRRYFWRSGSAGRRVFDFSFNYSIPEEDKLTVERDALLQAWKPPWKILASQGKEKLAKEETMEKALEKELKRQLESLGGGIRWEGGAELELLVEPILGERRYHSNTGGRQHSR